MLGRAELVRLLDEDGVGFVVYKASLSFRKGARLGDELEIRTVARRESDWRAIFEHSVWKEGEPQALVEGVVEMVCVDQNQKLVQLPESVDLSAYNKA
jgi:YbgC/YbaW family acyl-CoA thioester hydrolase